MISSILILLKKLWDNRYLVIFGLFSLLITTFYIYYLIATSRIENLTRQNQQLEKVVQEQQQTLKQIEKDYNKIIESKEKLSKEIEDIKTSVEAEKKKLFRENKNKKSLEELATKKTKLVEKKINDATEKVLKCFETISRGGDC